MDILLLFFCIAFVAGFIDSIAGGGGLITLPALMTLGVDPVIALGTNKLQSSGGAFSACYYFISKKLINLPNVLPAVIATFLGALIGVLLVHHLDTSRLNIILPFAIMLVGIYFLLVPSSSLEKQTSPKISFILFATCICSLIGFYDAMFGPATGSFFCLGFMLLRGMNLVKATAHAKLLNFTSNITALMIFISQNHVLWILGLAMLIGQILGAQLGARLVILKGNKLIKPLIVMVSLLLSAKLLYTHFYN